MYGKFFAQTFTGSLFGAGCDVFAVWGYVIANTVEHTVELNPVYLGAVLGASPSQIEAAIATLCAPDPASRTKTAQGRRLRHEAGFTYTVVNHHVYRALRNEDERRTYNREAKRKQRSRDVKVDVHQQRQETPIKEPVKQVVIDKPRLSNMSAHTEAEAEADTEARKDDDARAREAIVIIDPTPAPLITNSLEFERRLRYCAFVGERLEVPKGVHRNFLTKVGGDNPTGTLDRWYRELDADIVASAEAIPDWPKFLWARFESWAKQNSGDLTIAAWVKKLEQKRKAHKEDR